MLVAGFGAISLGGPVGSVPTHYCRGSKNWARRPSAVESHLGRMIRPWTVGIYQIVPHYLTYCRNLCILSTSYFCTGRRDMLKARPGLSARLQTIRNSCADLRRDCGPGCPALSGP